MYTFTLRIVYIIKESSKNVIKLRQPRHCSQTINRRLGYIGRSSYRGSGSWVN